MKKIIVLCIILLVGINSYAISDKAQFSLITVSPGDELYSTFGHSALRFYDPETRIDKIYNYGTFDFNAPGFYMNFTRGKLDYMLSVSNFYSLVRSAQYENRSVIEQVLDLEHADIVSLYRFLENNYLPENRFYKYDFFFDNCSTRIRDALISVCGDRLQYNFNPGTDKSFRQLIDEFLQDKKYQDLGMDIGLGSPADKKATAFDYMFLPEYLFDSFNEATIVDSEGNKKPLVKITSTHFEAEVYEANAFEVTPALLMWGFLALVVIFTLMSNRSPRLFTALDVILFGFTGFIGIILLLLWFATDHGVTAYNWDLVWAMPLNIIISVWMFRKKYVETIRIYLIIYAGVLVLFLAALNIIPQEINPAVIPMILAVIVRSAFIARKSFAIWS
jgi:hypothetical protein